MSVGLCVRCGEPGDNRVISGIYSTCICYRCASAWSHHVLDRSTVAGVMWFGAMCAQAELDSAVARGELGVSRFVDDLRRHQLELIKCVDAWMKAGVSASSES